MHFLARLASSFHYRLAGAFVQADAYFFFTAVAFLVPRGDMNNSGGMSAVGFVGRCFGCEEFWDWWVRTGLRVGFFWGTCVCELFR